MSQILYKPEEAVSLLRMGLTTVKAKIATGELRSIKIGRSRRIPAEALHEFVRRLDIEQNGDGAGVAAPAPSENTSATS
ncbi:helix-turn-helix domain-containing protein [Streptomyces bambusae]|uniref:helix-turn-helix domain-containing protein n=1 Tax=Streptomyces bambusae TaxID=1550616 RepID=UPI001CFC4B61|nr:helix-turn-helix domain-containing protein [Streptomyces bambusae]MCB5166049.1 helix-turn-helix domain-containing protein [Streptomyces bambusae]